MDQVIRFSDIYIIESLGEGGASRTGARLFEELQPLGLVSKPPVLTHYHRLATALEFWDLLDAIEVDARDRQRSPLLHIETHGGDRGTSSSSTSEGIYLASGELIRWTELVPKLTAINAASRLNLVVFVAACSGADLASIVRAQDRAPVRMVIGPKKALSFDAIEKSTLTFYRSLFRLSDGAAAWRAMNDALDPTEQMFWAIPVDWLFCEIMRGYFQTLGSKQVAVARVDRIIAEFEKTAPRALSQQERMHARVEMHRGLEDPATLFATLHRRFFFIDVYPENATRFDVAFDDCREDAGNRWTTGGAKSLVGG